MSSNHLLHDLVFAAAQRSGDRVALTSGPQELPYARLDTLCRSTAAGLIGFGLARAERVALYLDKRIEFVAAAFGASAAGGVFVPVNPLLKPAQVVYILRDCNVRVLVTSAERLALLQPVLSDCHDLRQIVVVGDSTELPAVEGVSVHRWDELAATSPRAGHRVIDHDMAAILYTSGSTGRPKGVVLSHRNLVVGAASVAQYLGNHPGDTLLAALPLSFDAGFSQLTTAFHAGARVVLINYLLPRDVINAVTRERVTGLTAVPPLWIQLARLDWPATAGEHLRYIASTGGRMPLETLKTLRARLPGTAPFLMYGLTEAFRATYLPPEELDRRPDSIGRAIPNAEVLVLREDGSECAANEPGELVQRGALVAMGYWNDPERTAERYKPLPAAVAGREGGLPIPEVAVFSGDTVRRDEDGFLYFIGRRDEMIKTSGYRVSPTEVEEILYASGLVGECVAFGVPHETLGQAICVVASPLHGTAASVDTLLAECRKRMPAYMVPGHLTLHDGPLPRNPNGKIDRKALSDRWLTGLRDPDRRDNTGEIAA
ncbi:MAG TPA: acyl-CoA ligase (AMP-forming), exosortase A system-associated [Rhodocyclaceae bacterium]|nr:acyl-CoA ligase (AMP-forming), exosortase A system-associated [Rhodocyclaceae bacterium]